MRTEAGQTIADLLIQQYGTVEALWQLVDDNRAYFSDEITRITAPGDEFSTWKADIANKPVQQWFAGRKVNTGLQSGRGTLSYELTEPDETIAGDEAVLLIRITNPESDLVADYVYITWGEGEGSEQQSFLLKEGATTEITSIFRVPRQWVGDYPITISGAIDATATLTVLNWILSDGTWNDNAYWIDEGTWWIDLE